MANPFNSEVGQQDKAGGSGKTSKRTSATRSVLKMKSANWPGLPGPSGPSHGSPARVVKLHTQSKGLRA